MGEREFEELDIEMAVKLFISLINFNRFNSSSIDNFNYELL
jgi:hypothetical protein